MGFERDALPSPAPYGMRTHSDFDSDDGTWARRSVERGSRMRLALRQPEALEADETGRIALVVGVLRAGILER